MLEAFAVSTGVVALGEVGDKTQLLALLLAARFRRPLPIIAGILVATLLNHALAVALGGWLAAALDPQALRWALGLSFLAVAAWLLVPDRVEGPGYAPLGRLGVFGVTAVAFFVAESKVWSCPRIGPRRRLTTRERPLHNRHPTSTRPGRAPVPPPCPPSASPTRSTPA